jgi:hypothetical protein
VISCVDFVGAEQIEDHRGDGVPAGPDLTDRRTLELDVGVLRDGTQLGHDAARELLALVHVAEDAVSFLEASV